MLLLRLLHALPLSRELKHTHGHFDYHCNTDISPVIVSSSVIRQAESLLNNCSPWAAVEEAAACPGPDSGAGREAAPCPPAAAAAGPAAAGPAVTAAPAERGPAAAAPAVAAVAPAAELVAVEATKTQESKLKRV